MSAIGNYIHYKQVDYNIYGITRNDPSAEKWDSAYAAQKNQYNAGVRNTQKDARAAQLEQQLNAIYYGEGESDWSDENIQKAMMIAIRRKLDETFNSANPEGTGDLDLAQQNVNLAARSLGNFGRIEYLQKTAMKKTLLNRISTIERYFDFIFSNSSIQKDVATISSTITKAQQELNIIKQQLKSETQDSEVKASMPASTQSIETVNKWIRTFFRLASVSNTVGQMGEYMTALIGFDASTVANKSLDEAVEQMVDYLNNSSALSGTGRTSVTYTNYLDPRAYSSESTDQIAPNLLITNKVVNKADITVTIKDEEGQNEVLNLSNKNEGTSQSDIKLVDQTNFYNAFSLTGNTDFMFHYLNVITKADIEDGAATPERIIEANRIARTLFFAFGLEGVAGDKGTNKANYLVVNRRNERHVYVYSIQNIINVLSSLLSSSADSARLLIRVANGDGGFITDDTFSMKNPLMNSAEQRNITILNTFKNFKLTLYLKHQALDMYVSTMG